MSTRAETLATRFEQANNDMIGTVEACNDAQWRAKTEGEGWSVGVVAHHVAQAHKYVADLAEMVAHGTPLPAMTWDQIHQGNAAHAQQHANCTRADTLALLRANGATAARMVRGLHDEQLQKTGSVLGDTMSAEQVIENVLIGHPQGHLGSIRAALGPK